MKLFCYVKWYLELIFAVGNYANTTYHRKFNCLSNTSQNFQLTTPLNVIISNFSDKLRINILFQISIVIITLIAALMQLICSCSYYRLNTSSKITFVHLPTLPVYCSHFTLGNPKKSFSTVLFIHTSDYLCYLREKNKLLPAYPPHMKNVTAPPCKM